MPDNRRAFAQRLQQTRESAGLSQYALAKRSGVSKQALSKLEMGTREPAWETVQRLAKALGVSCESFTDPGLSMPSEAEAAVGKVGRPPKASLRGAEEQRLACHRQAPPGTPPAADLEAQAKGRRQKEPAEGPAPDSKGDRRRRGKGK